MLHRALFGSLERFIGILIEHYSGKFPLWLSPTQVVLATVSEASVSYAERVKTQLESSGIRVEIDAGNEKISAKIRTHSTAKTPIIAVIGTREVEDNTLTIRRLDSQESRTLTPDELANIVYRR